MSWKFWKKETVKPDYCFLHGCAFTLNVVKGNVQWGMTEDSKGAYRQDTHYMQCSYRYDRWNENTRCIHDRYLLAEKVYVNLPDLQPKCS